MKPRIYRLSEEKQRCRRVLSAAATPPLSGKQTSWVTITRTGSFTDPRYGPFEITSPMLLSMVKNFDEQVVGQEIYIAVNHKPGDGAAAKILKLRVEGTRLRALAEWTDYGLKAVRERGFTYLSAEFADNWQDNEGGAFHGPTLLGAGLTVRPVIKRLEAVTPNATSGIFKTAKFPVVRPHQNLTLQGAAVGAAENPITIKIGATVVKAYDGTNAQPAGDYFRIVDLNQGIFQLVNQLGAPKAGAAGVKISYSQATNIVLFNLDVASGNTLEKHLNGLLREVGAAKASMSGQRYEHVDYLLMSPVLNDTISNAEQFVVSLKRSGSDTTGGGDLMKIKDIPAYSTNAPHTDIPIKSTMDTSVFM